MASINGSYGKFHIRHTGKNPNFPVEITARGFHNVVKDGLDAVIYLTDRFGKDVEYTFDPNIDFRNFTEVIRESVKHEKENDFNWNWYVKSIGKNSVKIKWGYLDYIGEDDDFFEIKATSTGDENDHLVGIVPDGKKEYVFVGEEHWNDAHTYEEAIRNIIKYFAYCAHMYY